MKASLKRLRTAVAASATSLTDIRGVGVVVAAMIIGHVGDVSRFTSPAHFASYNATAPIEASSGEQQAAPAEPARQPAVELGHPRRRDHAAPLPVRGTRLLRPQTRRRQEHQRSDPGVEAPDSPTSSTGPWSPTPADSSSDRQAREDNQERHEIQRDRLNILNGRLFG